MDNINRIHKQFIKMNYEQQHLLIALLAREHTRIRERNILDEWHDLLDMIMLDKINITINYIHDIKKSDDNVKTLYSYICNIILNYNDIEYTYTEISKYKKDAKKKAISLAYNQLKELANTNNLYKIKELKNIDENANENTNIMIEIN